MFHVVVDSMLSHYSLLQLINDIQHIHVHHWDHCRLFERIEQELGECDIAECLSFHRHFRDRTKYSDQMRRYRFYGLQWHPNDADHLEVTLCAM